MNDLLIIPRNKETMCITLCVLFSFVLATSLPAWSSNEEDDIPSAIELGYIDKLPESINLDDSVPESTQKDGDAIVAPSAAALIGATTALHLNVNILWPMIKFIRRYGVLIWERSKSMKQAIRTIHTIFYYGGRPVQFDKFLVIQRNKVFARSRQQSCGSMKSGFAPFGSDGHRIELHHVGQEVDGPLIEMTRTEHDKPGLHGFKNESEINRQQFNSLRKKYWFDRAISYCK